MIYEKLRRLTEKKLRVEEEIIETCMAQIEPMCVQLKARFVLEDGYWYFEHETGVEIDGTMDQYGVYDDPALNKLIDWTGNLKQMFQDIYNEYNIVIWSMLPSFTPDDWGSARR